MIGSFRFVLLIVALVAASVKAQTPVVILSSAADLRASVLEARLLSEQGIHVSVIVAPGCYIANTDPASTPLIRSLPGIGEVFDRQVKAEKIAAVPKQKRVALHWLNAVLDGDLDQRAGDPAMDWSGHPGDALERLPEQKSTSGSGASKSGGGNEAIDWTCTESYNSEYMWGTIVASTFFVESNGAIDANSYTWPQSVIDDVKLQMIDSWSIWSYTAGLNGRSITAVMNWYEPSGGIPLQPYEPITRPSTDDGLWIGAIMNNLGIPGSGSFGRLDAFHHDLRGSFNADHAFSAFIAYNPPAQSAPNQFTDGKIGYAYLGGPYTQLLYKANGWTTAQINRVYGHEVGHIFHAYDEYAASPSSNCTRYFNGEQNANYQGSPCNGLAGCVMISNSFTGIGATRHWDLCSHTPIHLGWTGLIDQPLALSPINDVIVTQNPVVLHWDRMGPPAGVYNYVKIFDRNTDEQVWCGYVGEVDTLAIDLLNGPYRWIASQGEANDYNGYAGRIGLAAEFTVNAPLHADFGRSTSAVCAGGAVTFTDESTGAPSSWSWQFPGGAPSTWIGQDPIPIYYNTPGSYDVTLVVGDGITTDTRTITNAITVTGGAALPFNEAFEGGTFPPTGWVNQGSGGTGGPGGQGGLQWQGDATGSCGQGISAHVNAFSYSGFFAAPQLTTPKISLIQAADSYLGFRWSYAQESATVTETLRLLGHDCEFVAYATLLAMSGPALATNGGGYVTAAAWVPTSCAHWKSKLVSLAPLQGRTTILDFRLDSFGGQDLFLDDIVVFQGSRLNLRVMLDGPFASGTGLMSDALRAQALIPASEPYTASGYVFNGEGGGEVIANGVLNTTGNNAIVDWVIVEVRDAADPTKILTSRAALVQRDGDVVDVDGASLVRVGVPAGNYHVAVKHRDHLGVMTAAPVALGQAMPLLDFSLPATPAWGTDARKISGATALLWAGDARGDGDLKYTGPNNDRDVILSAIGELNYPTATVTGYLRQDCNLDGVVKYSGAANDRDIILLNIGGTVPTTVRLQQVP